MKTIIDRYNKENDLEYWKIVMHDKVQSLKVERVYPADTHKSYIIPTFGDEIDWIYDTLTQNHSLFRKLPSIVPMIKDILPNNGVAVEFDSDSMLSEFEVEIDLITKIGEGARFDENFDVVATEIFNFNTAAGVLRMADFVNDF